MSNEEQQKYQIEIEYKERLVKDLRKTDAWQADMIEEKIEQMKREMS